MLSLVGDDIPRLKHNVSYFTTEVTIHHYRRHRLHSYILKQESFIKPKGKKLTWRWCNSSASSTTSVPYGSFRSYRTSIVFLYLNTLTRPCYFSFASLRRKLEGRIMMVWFANEVNWRYHFILSIRFIFYGSIALFLFLSYYAEERSQLANKIKALSRLKAKLLVIAEEQRASEIRQIRGDAVKAEWGQQIRNYVFHPYKLVKDVRTGLETSDITSVMDGELDPFIKSYLKYKYSRTISVTLG